MKKILTDVDGVLLNWEDAFTSWMAKKGYKVQTENHYNQNIRYDIPKEESNKLVTTFNDSAWMGWLRPLRDSVVVLPNLVNAGYNIECITSLSRDYYAGKLREYNLKQHFGNNIGKVICLEQGGDKDDILKSYEPGHWWIEDKPQNAEAGLNAGHKVILINHDYNEYYKNPDIFRVNSWSEIEKLILGEHND